MPDDPITEPITPEPLSESLAAYNVVSDIVTGVNVRWNDNKFQAVFILVSMIFMSVAGTTLGFLFGGKETPWFIGTVMGTFAGMVFGVFASGIYLMLYRAFRHIRGQHD